MNGCSRGCSGGPLTLPHKAIGVALAALVPLVESVGAGEHCLKAQPASPTSSSSSSARPGPKAVGSLPPRSRLRGSAEADPNVFYISWSMEWTEEDGQVWHLRCTRHSSTTVYDRWEKQAAQSWFCLDAVFAGLYTQSKYGGT